MRLDFCNSGRNLTIAFTEIKISNLLTINENGRVEGLMGRVIDKWFSSDPNSSQCRFVGVKNFGEKLSNETYTGALKLLKEGKVDVFPKPSPLNNYHDFLEIGGIAFEDGSYVGQFIKKKLANNRADALRMFDVEILLKVFPVMIFLIVFLFLFHLISYPNLQQKCEMIVGSLFETNYSFSKTMNAISLIILLYSVYFMIYKTILINNIKTNSVIVNTSELIDNKNDLLVTKKNICYYRNEIDIELAPSAPPASPLNKIYLRSLQNNNNQPCLFDSNPNEFLNYDIDSMAILTEGLILRAIFYSTTHVLNERHFFISRDQIHEMLQVTFTRKNLDPIFKKIALWHFEGDLHIQMSHKISLNLEFGFMFTRRLFKSKEEFIEEYSETHKIDFSYFENSFYLHLSSNLLIAISFFAIRLVIKILPPNNLEI